MRTLQILHLRQQRAEMFTVQPLFAAAAEGRFLRICKPESRSAVCTALCHSACSSRGSTAMPCSTGLSSTSSEEQFAGEAPQIVDRLLHFAI